MALTRWNPYRELNRFFEREGPVATTVWSPSVDIFENDNELVVKAELPGMELKDIEVTFENNVLTIKGERRFEHETKKEDYHRVEREFGCFSRSFALPTYVDEAKVKADYKDGILKVVLPKKELAKPKGITVNAA
jgi:HSP20 family protein